MEQIEKIKSGDFDEELITSTINNWKKYEISNLDNYRSRAGIMYDAFIKNLPWEHVVNEIDRISKITKDDVVRFANRHFGDNYVQVNKLQGEQVGVKKLEKPAITAIRTNRDTSSVFLHEITSMVDAAKPIEPVFPDFDKDLTVSTIGEGQKLIYKHNDDNELFTLQYTFDTGTADDNTLDYALQYFSNLGTDSLSADEIAAKYYMLASSFSISSRANRTTAVVEGLGSSYKEANGLFEDLLANVKADDDLLEAMKANWIREKLNDKTDKSENEYAINQYAVYGPVNSVTSALKPEEIAALTSEQLLEKVRDLFRHQYSVCYYGPLSEKEFLQTYPEIHKTESGLRPFAPTRVFKAWSTKEPAVYIAPYKANQINMYRILTYDASEYDYENNALTALYDEYFGAGMSSIVFQDIREAKGLAYHAAAFTATPSRKGAVPFYTARVYTQNDKMKDAMNAMDEILQNMPVVGKSFEVAKANLVKNLATARYYGIGLIATYINLETAGLPLDYTRKFYEKAVTLTLDDVVAYHEKMIKGRPFVTGILGNPEELDLSAIGKEYGKVNILKTEDIFGY